MVEEPRAVSRLNIAYLETHPGEYVNLAFSADDIGAPLLQTVSHGLYTNPLDPLREYLQNAVDADASTITIKFTAHSVFIHDDGTGMTLGGLVNASRIGLSPKRSWEHVGFRGIGIYSAFGVCDRLTITTTTAGEERLQKLTFNFAGMRAELHDAEGAERPDMALTDLLQRHTQIALEPSACDEHFTQVCLYDIRREQMQQLQDSDHVQRYLLENLPVDFADDFEFKEQINEQLRRNVDGYHPVTIRLQYDDRPEIVVAQEAIPHLQPPQFRLIRTDGGRPVAFMWSCLCNNRKRIFAERGDQAPTYQGFIYKKKGFTIGNRTKLRSAFQRDQFYPWYTGQIFVLDTDVIPIAERDTFEAGPATTALEKAVSRELGDLMMQAITYQEAGRADEKFAEIRQFLADIGERPTDSAHTNQQQVQDYRKFLERQKKSSIYAVKTTANALAQRLDGWTNGHVSENDDSLTQHALFSTLPPVVPLAASTPSISVQPAPPIPPKTLLDAMQGAGWDVSGSTSTLARVIQASLDQVLGRGNKTYRTLLAAIEERLIDAESGN